MMSTSSRRAREKQKGASDSSLKRIKNLGIHCTGEDGSTWGRHEFPIYLDTRGAPSFVMKLPEWVTHALNVPHQVNKPTAEEAEKEFTRLLGQYAEWKRTAVAELVIVVTYEGKERWGGHRHGKPDKEAYLSINYCLAFRINGKLFNHDIDSVRTHPEAEWGTKGWSEYHEVVKVGHQWSYSEDEAKRALKHTPELEAAIAGIIETVQTASTKLAELLKSDDVPNALLATSGLTLLPAPKSQDVIDVQATELDEAPELGPEFFANATLTRPGEPLITSEVEPMATDLYEHGYTPSFPCVGEGATNPPMAGWWGVGFLAETRTPRPRSLWWDGTGWTDSRGWRYTDVGSWYGVCTRLEGYDYPLEQPVLAMPATAARKRVITKPVERVNQTTGEKTPERLAVDDAEMATPPAVAQIERKRITTTRLLQHGLFDVDSSDGAAT